MKKLLLIFIAIILGNSITASEILYNFDTAIKVARKERKNVLLIFTLDECYHCDNLKSNLTNLDNINNYTICILDSNKHNIINDQMKIKRWPTSIIVVVGDKSYGEISRLIGYKNNIDYNKWLEKYHKLFNKQ